MILPKGNVDFSRSGGEGIMEEMIDMIRSENRTGYLLILGEVEDEEGAPQEITAQLLFDEGEPILCESVVNNNSLKGPKGVYNALKSMEIPRNTIEMHSKIDVGPPTAFFKECKIEEDDIDISAVKEKMGQEQEIRIRKEQERKEREEQKARIKEEVDSWISAGYKIGDYPEILEDYHDEIVNWHKTLRENINEIESISEWVRKIDDVELQEDKQNLLAKTKEPFRIDEIRKIKEELESQISHISDKRAEMEKWVNLWKDEGYNTEEIEKTLKSDLETAWNNLTKFMDDIQSLKDYREELEGIKSEIENDSFGPEIREIDFLLNDPMELSSIGELLENLKNTIKEESEEKQKLISRAQEWTSKGYELDSLKKNEGKRLEAFRVDFNHFMNNITRIEQIKDELKAIDRRDLPDEIDRMAEDLTDPFDLQEYEAALKELKDQIDLLNSKRKAIMDEVEQLSSEGFVTASITERKDSPVKELSALFEDFKGRVSELRDLRAVISDMDHRWLEDEFKSLEAKLNDVNKIPEIKSGIKELDNRIEARERKRQKMINEMEEWEKEGFDVSKLKEVIEDDEGVFTPVHENISNLIQGAKDSLKELSQLNVRFFPAEAKGVEKKLHDPFSLDEAKNDLASLKERIEKDWEIRNELDKWMEGIKNEGWDLEGLEDITDSSPSMIEEKVRQLKGDVEELKGLLADIDNWDELETKWLASNVSNLKDHLKRVADKEKAISHYNELKDRIGKNSLRREQIRKAVGEWKESGLVVNKVEDIIEENIDELDERFMELETKVGKLQELTEKFDSLKVDHFRSEAEEIEFKLNDPYMVEEISENLEALIEKINEDENRRKEFRQRIKDYVEEGFMGAEKLEEVMNEDISIVEIEFKNFEKEVQLLRKYMDSTGFSHASKKEDKAGKKEEEEKEPKNKDSEKPDSITEEKETTSESEASPASQTFENFVVGMPNEMAHKTALEVVDKPGVAYNPLVILGDEGSGKTHLINSIMNKIKTVRPNMNVAFNTGKGFLRDVEKFRKDENMEGFRDMFRNSDAMVMEDLDEFGESEEGQDIFINIMTGMLDNGKQVVLTSKRDIKAIPKIYESIRASLDTGTSVDLEGTNEDFNRALISSVAGEDIKEPVVGYLSQTLLGSVGQVRDAIDRIMDAEITDDDEGFSKAKEIIDSFNEDKDHKDLTAALEDTLNEIKVDDPEELIVCTNCDKDIPGDSTSCPHCGAIFEDVEMKECPVCKELMEMDKSKCPNCGTDL